jgi:hypothetical protein
MARTPETVNDPMGGGMGCSLQAIGKGVGGVYCECGSGAAVKMGLRRTLLSSS